MLDSVGLLEEGEGTFDARCGARCDNDQAPGGYFALGTTFGDTIKGEAFFPMMMKVWIGPKVRGSTRDALLGQGAK